MPFAPFRLPLVVVALAALALPASAQHADPPRGAEAPRIAAPVADAPRVAPDSISYDAGMPWGDSYLGYGPGQAMHGAVRFSTGNAPFHLAAARLSVWAESQPATLTLRVYDASGGLMNPTGGQLLRSLTTTIPAGDPVLRAVVFEPVHFEAGTSFFIVASVTGAPHPLAAHDAGTGDYHDRSFFSQTGAPGSWGVLSDVIGDGTPDVWLLRALGTRGVASGPALTVAPEALAVTLTGGTATRHVLLHSYGLQPVSWSVSTAPGTSRRPPSASEPTPAGPDDRAALFARAGRGGRVPVIVRLAVPFTPEAELPERNAAAQRAALTAAREAVLDRLAAHRPEAVKRFETVPFVAATVDAAGLAALARDPDVAALYEDRLAEPHLPESLELIGAPAAWATGYTGAGVAVAVLDTGAEVNHPFLAGRTVAEACFSSTVSGQSASVCPNGQNQQVGPGAAAPPGTHVSSHSHGTHVAGIALGQNASFSGVAPEASHIAVQVFSRFDGQDQCGNRPAPCLLAYVSDQMLGLEYVYGLRTAHTIASANMSLGGGSYAAACDGHVLKPIVDNLRAARIATVASAGNDGHTNGIGAPACISSVVSVGSTQDGSAGTVADRVSPFSNSAPILDLLAPGQVILSSVVNGQYANLQGTSMAAPHVAGAWAVLRQRHPTLSVSALLDLVAATGVPVADHRNGLVRPRLHLGQALGSTVEWLSATPASGTVPAQSFGQIAVTMDATGLAPGSHHATLYVTSNDGAAPVQAVAVTLTVPEPVEMPALLTHVPAGAAQVTVPTSSGGYVHGTNAFAHQGKAAAFTLPLGVPSVSVEGVEVHFSERLATPVLAEYHVRLYEGTLSDGPLGEPLASKTYLLADVVSGAPAPATVHLFDAPVEVSGTFFVTVEYPGPYGLLDFNIASTAALGLYSPYEWEQRENGAWYNMSLSWFGAGNNGWHMFLGARLGAGVAAEAPGGAGRAVLGSGFPNPTRGAVTLPFTLAEAAEARLEVFDALGRRVAVLADGPHAPGAHRAVWDAQSAAAGLYVVRLRTGGAVLTERLVVVR